MARSKHNPGRKKRGSKIRYNAEQRWKKNKVRTLVRHVNKFPNDETAKAALQKAEHLI